MTLVIILVVINIVLTVMVGFALQHYAGALGRLSEVIFSDTRDINRKLDERATRKDF